MDAPPHELGNRLIDHAVAGNPGKTPKAFGHYAHAKVPAFACSRVPDVQGALIAHEDLGRPELTLDRGANACSGVGGGHGACYERVAAERPSGAGEERRASHNICSATNATVASVTPKTLKFTQTRSLA
jgi:hypothetical protein